jgi:hypothetical protein
MGILSGKIIKVGETEQIKDTFKKRELVIETDEKYPQSVPVEFVQDKTELLDGLNEGDSVAVSYNLRGREWNGRYYVNVQGWKLEKTSSAPAPAPVTVDETDSGADDDLPF